MEQSLILLEGLDYQGSDNHCPIAVVIEIPPKF